MDRQPVYRSPVLDHLGLVAGLFEALGIGEVVDQATQQNPETHVQGVWPRLPFLSAEGGP